MMPGLGELGLEFHRWPTIDGRFEPCRRRSWLPSANRLTDLLKEGIEWVVGHSAFLIQLGKGRQCPVHIGYDNGKSKVSRTETPRPRGVRNDPDGRRSAPARAVQEDFEPIRPITMHAR
jgi:hypothetical protein